MNRRLQLHEIRVSTGPEPPLIVMREVDGDRLLPIWTSFEGAATVVTVTQAEEPEAPTLLDAICELTEGFEHRVESVRLLSYREGRYFAAVLVDGREFQIRPSDGIALALRMGVPIQCPEELLREVGVVPEPGVEVERFLEFLETVDPTDFERS